MKKIDRNDAKILAVLDADSRSTLAEIARRTGIGQETVRYRFNRLREEGVIRHCATMINATVLGYTYYQLLLKLQNIDSKKRESLLSFLRDHSRIGWVAELEGAYDVAIITPVRHQPELQKLIDELYDRFSSNIMRKTLSVNLSGEFFPRDYLLGKKRALPKNAPTYSYQDQRSLSEDEESLCRLLALNSRTTAIECAQRMRVSIDSALRALRSLERDGIILHHALTLDLSQIGRSHYKILLYLNNTDPDMLRRLREHVRADNRSLAIIRSLSEYDFEIDYELEDPQQLREVTMDLTNRFSAIIRDYSVLRVTDMHKYTFFP